MVDVNDYRDEKSCIYKDEEYLVRDNGAVFRKARPNQRVRKLDNEWTFGKLNIKTGYLEIASVRVHRIVALYVLKKPKISPSGQTCSQKRTMGLFNPRSREEQANYIYHENARFREDLRENKIKSEVRLNLRF